MNAAFASRLGSGFHNLAAMEPLDIVIVGGCGHVGLPLALSFADAGYRVGVDDIDTAKIERVRAGEVPFKEAGAEQLLRKLLPTGLLEFGSEPAMLKRAGTVVIVIGTPIDEFMNPSVTVFDRVVDELIPHLQPASLVVLRSTVFPGTAEGMQLIRTTPVEAELAKLLTNTWRYMKFAIANQFFQIAHRSGVDYNSVLDAIRNDYPRAADLPGPGFAAGPCLLKDTMQLSAFTPDHFPMGQAAMQINEGLPNYIVDTLNSRRPLSGRTIGILGMAFKGESDDPRASLSYKLRKLAAFKGARVLCTDPYIHDESFVSLDRVLKEAEVLVIAAPHRAYKKLDLKDREVVDVWGITGPIRL